jgi:thioredoxin 1
MATVEINKNNFENLINDNEIVLIDFWAQWCGPCKMFGPVFEKVSEQNEDIVFGSCDTEKAPELAAAFNVRSIPTLAVFRDNVLLYLQPGALPEDALVDVIKQVRALDMDEVRQEIEEKKKEQESEGDAEASN